MTEAATRLLMTFDSLPQSDQHEILARLLRRANIVSEESTPEWNEYKNTRRRELIDREIQGSLTPDETLELETLQRQAIAYRDAVAPPPLEFAQELHRRLLNAQSRVDS